MNRHYFNLFKDSLFCIVLMCLKKLYTFGDDELG